MKMLQRVGFMKGAAVLLLAGLPAHATGISNCDYRVTESRAIYGSLNNVAGKIWAEDIAGLGDKSTVLRPALNTVRNTLDQAVLDLQETEIDAAGALVNAFNAEDTVAEARNTLNTVTMELRIAKAERRTLQAMPISQENASDIADLEAEITMLSVTFDGAKGDLQAAERAMRVAQAKASDAENAIALAENSVNRAKQVKTEVLSLIALHEIEQGGETAFEIVSGPDPKEPGVQTCKQGS